MTETLQSIIEDEMQKFTPEDRQRLVDGHVYLQITQEVYGETGVRSLINSIKDEQKVEDVRAVVGRVVKELANKANLG